MGYLKRRTEKTSRFRPLLHVGRALPPSAGLTSGRWRRPCGRWGGGPGWGSPWRCDRPARPSSPRPGTPRCRRKCWCSAPAHRPTAQRTTGRTGGRPTRSPASGPGGGRRSSRLKSKDTASWPRVGRPTFRCSDTRKRISSSSWLLMAAGSREGAQSGGRGARALGAPGAHTDFRASSVMAFHRDGFCREGGKQTSQGLLPCFEAALRRLLMNVVAADSFFLLLLTFLELLKLEDWSSYLKPAEC